MFNASNNDTAKVFIFDKENDQIINIGTVFDAVGTIKTNVLGLASFFIRGKASHQAPQDQLKSLQIPTEPWSSISMDFIVKLPKSNGFDSIWVVVDRLTKMAHFVPCRESTNAKELANIFIQNIFRLHGLPKSIVSDRGVLFTSKFWKHLLSKLNINCNMSTSHRPQTDGQTEKTNLILEQYLRMFSNYYQQDNWSELLSVAEFSYNNYQ
jgi:transposase InsO family protein